MSLHQALTDDTVRALVAADAVAEAKVAIADRGRIRGAGAQIGLDTINRLRPGFLERHIHAMLPAMARAIEPHWSYGVATGDGCAHFEANASEITEGLLAVTDSYVADASDATAIAVYMQLRSRAPNRIAEQMPRIARFIERHTPEL